MNHKILATAFAFGIWGAGQWVSAENTVPQTYEIYSWKNGNEWDYAVIPAGHNEAKAAVEIKQAGGPLRGASKVKEKLLAMKEGDQISWQERPKSDMVYPPNLVMEDINQYAQSVGVLPEKPIKNP